MPTEKEIEFAAAAISREGFPKGQETARDYRLRLARAALTAAEKERRAKVRSQYAHCGSS